MIANKSYDVVIVGAGGAGLAAALQAKQEGLRPLILEKMSEVRGNTKAASAGMNASETLIQKRFGVQDSNECFYKESYKSGKEANDPVLLNYLVTHSKEAIEWLDSLGIRLDRLTQMGGMSKQRTHRPTDGSPIGAYLIKSLLACVEKEEIPILLSAKATKIHTKEGRINGVNIIHNEKELRITSQAVVMTTGGFGANKEMIKELAPELEEYRTTNHSGATGDGIKLIQEVAGDVRDLEYIQVHPTVHKESGFLITEAVRGEGAILVNQRGERFINEMETRDKVSHAMNQLSEKRVYLIFDQGVRERVPAIDFYHSKGFIYEASNLNDLSKKCRFSIQSIKKSITEWNKTVENLQEDKWSRQTAKEYPLNQPPYYALPVVPGIHHTMGGVVINNKAEVLTKEKAVIKGLYAAGEVVGGVHGRNRLGGNALTEIIVFGRQAGKQAAQYIHSFPQHE